MVGVWLSVFRGSGACQVVAVSWVIRPGLWFELVQKVRAAHARVSAVF